MKELETLIENFWIIKEKNVELYHKIRDASPKFKEFIQDKLGYRLIVNPYLIKLEKLPGKSEAWMGIQDFDSQLEYGMFCILLAFLEERGPGEQFVLSQVTEYVQSTWPGIEKLDWTLFRHRRSLVKVLRYASEMYLLRVDDGDEGKFMDAADTEVLYDSTSLSRYFMRHFTTNILNYNGWQDIEAGEWLEADRDRGRVRRNRVYRRLVMSPAVYNEGGEDADYAYIKNKRNFLQKDFEEMLGAALHVHKNGAFLVLDQSTHYKDVFPGNSTLSDIVLQVNAEILEMLNSGQLQRREDDIIITSRPQFDAVIEKCRVKYLHGWSKEYREMGIEGLCTSVIHFMEDFSMIGISNGGREIHIMPLCGKMIGSYPESFSQENSLRS
jgi:uncharacterized protein (TIGR02678 family)